MSTLEVKTLALQLSSVIDLLEKRIDHATQQSLQATHSLDQQSRKTLEAANRSAQQALEQFRQGAQQAIAEGVRDAAQELDQTLRNCTGRIEQATEHLDLRLQHMGRVNTVYAWKTFIASAAGSLAVIAIALYVAWQAHTDIKRSDWVQQINAAVEAGHLANCPEGGLCVQVDNKWVRVHSK